jgi:nucleoside-diphosphate-sugar epimerase
MKILLIGSRGFTGHHLLAALRATPAHDVAEAAHHGLDLTRPDTIRDTLAATAPEIVVNLGAISHVGGAMRDLYEVNAFGQHNLLEALQASGFAGLLVFASTANVYGDRTPEPIREDRTPDPINHYACSKLLAEQFCRMFEGQFRIAVTRPFSCIGAGQAANFLVPKIVGHFRRREKVIELGNIDVQRDFVDIRDAAAAYRLLIEAPAPPRLVHICTGGTRSLRDILDVCTAITGHHMKVKVNSALIRSNDLLYQCGDPARLASLGFTSRFRLEDTLQWMLGTCWAS